MNNSLHLWFLIFLLLVLVIALNTVAGCAQVPNCERFAYSVHIQQGVTYYVLDEDNAVKLVQILEGLNNGTCKVEG